MFWVATLLAVMSLQKKS